MLSVILVVFYNRISRKPAGYAKDKKLLPWLAFIPLVGLTIIATRGGTQYKPIGIMAAARHTNPQLVPLVLNTPFTVYKTFGKSLLEEKSYFNEKEINKYFNKNHNFNHSEPLPVVECSAHYPGKFFIGIYRIAQ